MREIKFRAWDAVHKKWIHDEKDIWMCVDDGRTAILKPTGGYESQDHLYGCSVTLLQFTGLKDKNVKEIYEGDIVKAVYNTDKNKEINENHSTVEKIVWKNGGLFMENYTNDLGWQCKNLDVEVIGNIFENSELMGTPGRD